MGLPDKPGYKYIASGRYWSVSPPQPLMNTLRTFLLIDDKRETSYVLTKTLVRRFPAVNIYEAADKIGALEFARRKTLDAIIVRHVWDADVGTIIGELRAIRPTVPIVAVSSVDCAKAALASGADRFLNYEEWLRIGSVVAEVLGVGTGDTPIPPLPPGAPAKTGGADAAALRPPTA